MIVLWCLRCLFGLYVGWYLVFDGCVWLVDYFGLVLLLSLCGLVLVNCLFVWVWVCSCVLFDLCCVLISVLRWFKLDGLIVL